MSRFLVALISLSALLCSCTAGTGSSEAPQAEAVPEDPAPPAAPAEAPVAETASSEAEAVSGDIFGEPITLTGPISAADVIKSPADYTDKTILVQGEVVDVCQKAGCWMVITDGENQIRVTMKGHGFAVRKDGAGSIALIQGKLQHIAPDPERTAHLESESAKPEAMPEKAGLQYEIDASGVSFSEAPKAG